MSQLRNDSEMTAGRAHIAPLDHDVTTTRAHIAPLYHEVARRTAIAGANEARRLLAAMSDADQDAVTLSFAGHHGEPARAIDVSMSGFIRREVEATGATYLSEELHAAVNLEPGCVIGHADPLDGTSLAVDGYSSWAVVVFFDVVRRGGVGAHLAGAIATATGHVVSWWCVGGFGEVWVESAAPFQYEGHAEEGSSTRIVYSVDADDSHFGAIRDGRADHVAAVAWSAERQERLTQIFDLSDGAIALKNTAGNPDVVGLLRGEIGALVEVDTVDLHDATYLVPFALLGGRITSLSGDDINVFRYFERLDPSARKVGPFIAASSDLALTGLLARRRKGFTLNAA